MIVIAIIIIVAAVTVSGLGTNSARQLGAAGNTVADLINEARQNAISRSLPTAFIMVDKSGNSQVDNRLFVLAELVPASPDGTTPAYWQQVSKWTLLPNGVIAYATGATSDYFSISSPTLPVDFSVGAHAISYQGTTITSSISAYEVFLPSGALLGTTTPPFLYLTTGIMNNGSPTYFGKTASGGTPDNGGNMPANYYEITINAYTGIPKIDRP
jgi:type II secretory pathway pseudopilin PulG